MLCAIRFSYISPSSIRLKDCFVVLIYSFQLHVKTLMNITASTPKSVPPHDRVKAYPEEQLTVSNNKLFCTACREELSLKKSVLE